MKLIFTVFALLFNGAICMDPIDIDIFHHLLAEGIKTEEVTFHGMNYKIMVPLEQFFFRKISFNTNILFLRGSRECMKIVILTGDTLTYIFLDIIQPDGENITERHAVFGNVCFLERVAGTFTTVNNIIEIMNHAHHSLNNRGFNMPLSNFPFQPVGGPDDDQGPDDDDSDDEGPQDDIADQFPQPPDDNDDDGNDDLDGGQNDHNQDQDLAVGFQGFNQLVQNNILEDPNPHDDIPILMMPDDLVNQGDLDVLAQLEDIHGIDVPNNSPLINPNQGGYFNFMFEPEIDLIENNPGNNFLNQPLLQQDWAQVFGDEDDDENNFEAQVIEIGQDNQVVPEPYDQLENEVNENGFYDFDADN